MLDYQILTTVVKEVKDDKVHMSFTRMYSDGRILIERVWLSAGEGFEALEGSPANIVMNDDDYDSNVVTERLDDISEWAETALI